MLDAVWLALGGMAIVFAVLSLLLLTMVIVKRAFPARNEEKKGGA